MLAPQKTSLSTQDTEQETGQTSYAIDNRTSTARQLTIQRMMNNDEQSESSSPNWLWHDEHQVYYDENDQSNCKTEDGTYLTYYKDDEQEYYYDSGGQLYDHVNHIMITAEMLEEDDVEQVEQSDQEQGEQLDEQDEAEQGEQDSVANSVPDWEDWTNLVKKHTKEIEVTEESTGNKSTSRTINYTAAMTQYLIYLEAWHAHYQLSNADIDKNQWVETEKELIDVINLTESDEHQKKIDIAKQQVDRIKFHHKWVKDVTEDKGFVESKKRQKEAKLEEIRKNRAAKEAQERAEKLKRDAEFRANKNKHNE